MNQSDLARRLNTSPSTVNQWARGLRTPDINSCFAIADQFDLPPNEVLRVAGHPIEEDGNAKQEDEHRLLIVWRKLNPEARQDLMQYAQFLRGKVGQE